MLPWDDAPLMVSCSQSDGHCYFRGEYFVYDLNDNTAPNIVQRVWDRRSFHYDNCAIAMITLFAVQTSEGWIE